MSDYVSVEEQDRVQHIVMDRPEKRNAINGEMVLELREAVRDAADSHDVHCVVLRGAGPAFSAGIDVSQLGSLSGTQNLRPFRRACIEVANLLEEMAKPVIAQIHGPCLGLGAARARRDRAFARDPRRVAALSAAILLGIQIVANYWTYAYLPWVFPLIALALLCEPRVRG